MSLPFTLTSVINTCVLKEETPKCFFSSDFPFIKMEEPYQKVPFWIDHNNILEIFFDEIKNSSTGTDIYGCVYIMVSGDFNMKSFALPDKFVICHNTIQIEAMSIMETKEDPIKYAPNYGTVMICFKFSPDLLLLFNLFDIIKKKEFIYALIRKYQAKKPTIDYENCSLYKRLIHHLVWSFENGI